MLFQYAERRLCTRAYSDPAEEVVLRLDNKEAARSERMQAIKRPDRAQKNFNIEKMFDICEPLPVTIDRAPAHSDERAVASPVEAAQVVHLLCIFATNVH